MSTTDTGVTRINITVPKWLIAELEKEVPERGKSGFVSEAIKEKLLRKKRVDALKALAKLPPTFKGINGKDYIEKLRAENEERTTRLGV